MGFCGYRCDRMPRVRLDSLLAERGLYDSRTRAAAAVLAGDVLLLPGRRRADKPGQMVTADVELEVAMGVVRETVRLGLAARGQAKLGVRQPLRAAVVVAAGGERAAIERLGVSPLHRMSFASIAYQQLAL